MDKRPLYPQKSQMQSYTQFHPEVIHGFVPPITHKLISGVGNLCSYVDNFVYNQGGGDIFANPI